MQITLYSFLFICITSFSSFGQFKPQESKWYFGNNVGVDFMSGSPVMITTSGMKVLEGSSSIADVHGNVLFYMNGKRVWDPDNISPPNGWSLMGDNSSSQGTLIAQVPGNPNRYYLFTTDGTSSVTNGPLGQWDGLHYSIFDVSLPGNGSVASPRGDILPALKNISLNLDSTAEKITATKHSNGVDYWVVTKDHDSDTIFSFLVTCQGIDTIPVASAMGVSQFWSGVGYLRFSADGRTLVNTELSFSSHMMDFDNMTGMVSNPKILFTDGAFSYQSGIAFSPNDSLIYIGTSEDVRSYERYAPMPKFTERVFPVGPPGIGFSKALLLAPDNKIYISNNLKASLSVISDPDNMINPDVLYAAVPLSDSSRYGLPNYFVSSIKSVDAGTGGLDVTICSGNSVQLGFADTAAYSWSPVAGLSDPAISNPIATPDSTTTYYITTTNPDFCVQTDSVTIFVNPKPTPTLPDTSICENTFVDLDAGSPGSTYLWSTGETDQVISTNAAGVYWVVVESGSGCSDSVGFTLTTQPCNIFTVSIGQSTNNTCFADSIGTATVSSTGGVGPYGYNWSPYGGSDSVATGLAAGTYNVQIWDSNGDTVLVNLIITEPSAVTASLTNQSDPLCNGDANGFASVASAGGTGAHTYLWDDPSSQTNSTATGLPAGIYSVIVADTNGCTTSINLLLDEPDMLNAVFSNSVSSLACQGDCNGSGTVLASGGSGNITYLWSAGQTATSLNNLCAGNYSVTVTDSNNCQQILSLNITEPLILSASISPIDPLCNGAADGMIDVNATGGSPSFTYLWDDPSSQTNSTASGLVAGQYTVTITDTNGCSFQIGGSLQNPPSMVLSTQDEKLCLGQSILLSPTITGNSGNMSCIWMPDSGLSNNGACNPVASPSQTTIYTLSAMDQCDTISSSMTVTVNPNPFVDAGEDKTISPGQSGVLNSSSGNTATYLWSPPESLDNPQASSPIASPMQTTTYTVTVTDVNGCSGIDTVIVFVDSDMLLFVPNIFSPNTDGMNDMFRIEGKGIREFHLMIFNRWGEKVFEADDISREWDGNFDNEFSGTEVFAYQIVGTYYDETPITIQGTISVVR